MDSSQAHLSIGDVSERTGVNTVTLRAWQRRYGLLKPQRTPKGHRLYSDQDVLLIKEILSWLEKGVAVSQVKTLLGKKEIAESSESQRVPELIALKDAITRFDSKAVHSLLADLTRNYPIKTLSATVLKPLSEGFEHQNSEVAKLCSDFWQTQLSNVLIHRFHNNHKVHTKKSCWLVSMFGDETCLVYIEALKLQGEGYNVTVLEGMESGMLLLFKTLSEKKIEKLVIYSDQSFSAPLRRDIEEVLENAVLETDLVGQCRLIHPDLIGSAAAPSTDNLGA
ncbi:MerR family transcriptional regulator [Enterovibrio calviensis]|uniref:MerR family transcriptional regulator n=1 Tax=Enterovibrio calviensis TaxID=91359 RepID=UPI0004854051|nr:MerR family transcriptional regulator [Enterovibrio calviensis]